MTKELCECGHSKIDHRSIGKKLFGTECMIYYCSCKKFKPSQGMTQEVPQNHSPSQIKLSRKEVINPESRKENKEDKEPEHLRGSKKPGRNSGSDNHTTKKEYSETILKEESLSDKRFRQTYNWKYYEKDVKEFIKIIDRNSIKIKSKDYYKKASKIIDGKRDIRLVDFTEFKERAGKELI